MVLLSYRAHSRLVGFVMNLTFKLGVDYIFRLQYLSNKKNQQCLEDIRNLVDVILYPSCFFILYSLFWLLNEPVDWFFLPSLNTILSCCSYLEPVNYPKIRMTATMCQEASPEMTPRKKTIVTLSRNWLNNLHDPGFQPSIFRYFLVAHLSLYTVDRNLHSHLYLLQCRFWMTKI